MHVQTTQTLSFSAWYYYIFSSNFYSIAGLLAK